MLQSLEKSGTAGYADIGTDLSRCEDVNPNVKVRITMEFEIPKVELLARRSAFVLGFNIAPSAHKQFYFQQSSSSFGVSQRPLMDYELEIVCEYNHPLRSWTQYIVFGSGVQKNGQNGINIPIYEIKMMAFCSKGKIRLIIHQNDRETTNIGVKSEFLLKNDAFNIDMTNKTVQPISQGRT
ncbi:hypothetical protein GPALN_010107 [Globodera pallida]|nr:hypothetical protein GPALN_010107 [Globodera pallida]